MFDRFSGPSDMGVAYDSPPDEPAPKGKRAKLEVWQRETVWLGAEGVAAKEQARIDRRAGIPSTPKTLAAFLALPLWKGATVTRTEGPERVYLDIPVKAKRGPQFIRLEGPCFPNYRYEITHPSGATATLRSEAFLDGSSYVGFSL